MPERIVIAEPQRAECGNDDRTVLQTHLSAAIPNAGITERKFGVDAEWPAAAKGLQG
jgi:hypothetical protein